MIFRGFECTVLKPMASKQDVCALLAFQNVVGGNRGSGQVNPMLASCTWHKVLSISPWGKGQKHTAVG